PAQHADMQRGGFRAVLASRDLLSLNVGVFALHAIQLSMWVAVPALLVQAGLVKSAHWQVYLPAVLASFVVMGGTLFPLERRGYLRQVLLAAIVLLGLVQLGFLAVAWNFAGGGPSVTVLALLLLLFFCSFNVLEASQPSLVSRLVPGASRGAALGLYNTLQSLGLFAGGALGGALLKWGGLQGLFICTTVLSVLWLVLACWLMPAVAGRPPRATATTPAA
ncbi:MAG: MFS transporter, partial [Comamonadaceae bacterium]